MQRPTLRPTHSGHADLENTPFCGAQNQLSTNFLKVSEECEEALNGYSLAEAIVFGGSLVFENGSCTAEEKAGLQTAVYDALYLSSIAHVPTNAREFAPWRDYVGPDYVDYQQRMLDNLRRVEDFHNGGKFDIIVSCKDTQNQCGEVIDGLTVGGYAWTYYGWFGRAYHYITLCPSFHLIDQLDKVMDWIEETVQRGDPHYAQDPYWLTNRGQFFLHEMMHLDSIGQPKVEDLLVNPSAAGSKRAYGPKLVYKLANLKNVGDQKGGAEFGSRNADTYAWLVTILFFYELSGYYALPPQLRDGPFDDQHDSGPISINIGDIDSNTTDSEIAEAFGAFRQGFSTEDPQATPSAPDVSLPSPICTTTGVSIPLPTGELLLDDFCSNQANWNITIVPQISFGNGKTSSGKQKARAVYGQYNLTEIPASLWMRVSFVTEGNCTGSFLFTQGTDHESKRNFCKNRFRTILELCQPNTTSQKLGGSFEKGCAVCNMIAVPNVVDPFPEDSKDPGRFLCEKTDDVCTCWYESFPGLVDWFRMPSSGDCKDVSTTDLLSS